MYIGKVMGSVTLSKGDLGLRGKKLIIVRLMDRKGNLKKKYSIVVDKMGAGYGETVLLVKGREGVDMITGHIPASDLTICGIIDEIYTEDQSK